MRFQIVAIHTSEESDADYETAVEKVAIHARHTAITLRAVGGPDLRVGHIRTVQTTTAYESDEPSWEQDFSGSGTSMVGLGSRETESFEADVMEVPVLPCLDESDWADWEAWTKGDLNPLVGDPRKLGQLEAYQTHASEPGRALRFSSAEAQGWWQELPPARVGLWVDLPVTSDQAETLHRLAEHQRLTHALNARANLHNRTTWRVWQAKEELSRHVQHARRGISRPR